MTSGCQIQHNIFSMTAHLTRSNVREHAHISMPTTTSTDTVSISFPVSSVIKHFILGKKLVGLTSDGKTNLVIYKAILESNFDNTGVFDSGKPMFMMKCLAHVLANS